MKERRTRQLQTAHDSLEGKKNPTKKKKRETTRQQTGIFKTCQKDYKKHLLHGTNKTKELKQWRKKTRLLRTGEETHKNYIYIYQKFQMYTKSEAGRGGSFYCSPERAAEIQSEAAV